MLAEEGTTILKFFLHISKGEQKRRLESRLMTPEKLWKFNPDDLADRARWGGFMHAYEGLLSKVSRREALWHVVPADKKWYRDLCVAKRFVDTLKGLNPEIPMPSWDPADMKID